jgi:hypothetical protein
VYPTPRAVDLQGFGILCSQQLRCLKPSSLPRIA